MHPEARSLPHTYIPLLSRPRECKTSSKDCMAPRAQSSPPLHMAHHQRLFLHIGAHKTGTSAIQFFLASNVENLRRADLDYLNAVPLRQVRPTPGNGNPIFLYFQCSEAEPKTLESLINGYFGTQHTAIISSEDLSSLAEPHWRLILDACQSQNIIPFVIYYVRDVYPYCWSSFNQRVKAHGWSGSFEEFAEKHFVFNSRIKLELLARLAGPDHLLVNHYESEQANICHHFMSLVCPTWDPAKFEFPADRANRSLDEAELRLMRIANKYPGLHLPWELAMILMSSDPDRRAEKPLYPGIVELLTQRHSADVLEINNRYFGGRQILQIGEFGPTSVEDTSKATAPAEKLFEWALARLNATRHEDLHRFLVEARSPRRPLSQDRPSFHPARFRSAGLSSGQSRRPYRRRQPLHPLFEAWPQGRKKLAHQWPPARAAATSARALAGAGRAASSDPVPLRSLKSQQLCPSARKQ